MSAEPTPDTPYEQTEPVAVEEKNDADIADVAKLPLAGKITSKAFMGGLAGYMVGRFAKQITDTLIYYAGVATVTIGCLHWM